MNVWLLGNKEWDCSKATSQARIKAIALVKDTKSNF
jgi:hypothetical protein